MRPVLVSAFLAGALCSPALADPIAITPEAYAAAAAQQGADAVSQQRYAQASQQNMGGGFIEFLFGGAAAASAPRAYQPAPQQSYGGQPAQSYAPPQDYAPQQGYAPTQDYAPQQAYAPQGYAPSSQGDMAHPQIDPKFERQMVAYNGNESPGTIVIDTPHKFLFLVEDNGKALRYGIGVGRPGFTWAGEKTITNKREWPDWRPARLAALHGRRSG
jgi:lipoprotein-anchoring transpeptidase ErfK/SrfK